MNDFVVWVQGDSDMIRVAPQCRRCQKQAEAKSGTIERGDQ